MLDSIRKRKNNFIYSIIILLTVAVMAFYGIDQMSGDSKGGGIAAWVNGEAISQQELGQEMERRIYQYQTLFGGQFDPQMLGPDFPRQVLEQLMRSKLIAQQSKKMTMLVTDEELAEFIRSIPAYQKNGKFDALRYTQVPNRGLLERNWRERLLINKFQDYVSGRAQLTPEELRQHHWLSETKIDLHYARIDFERLAKNHKPIASELARFEKSTPESQFQAYYDAHKSEYSEKAKVHLRQIRVGIPYEASDAQKATSKKKIDDIAKEATANNFAEMAKRHSDDEVAKKGGDAGWITEGALERPLEEAIAKLKPGELSAPVQASFGHFIFQLLERKPAVQKALADARKSIVEKLYLEKYAKDFSEKTRQQWNTALAAGRDIQTELKNQRVEIKKTGPFSVGTGEVPGVGASEAILDTAFELTAEKPLAKTLVFFQDNYYYLRLAKFEPARAFDATKDTQAVEKAWKSRVEDQILRDWVAQLEKKANRKVELKLGPEAATAIQ